jgi:hypothetical protein
VAGHADALEALDDDRVTNAAELVRDAGKLRDRGVSPAIGVEDAERVFLRRPAPLPAWPVEGHGHGHGLLPAKLHHHADRVAHERSLAWERGEFGRQRCPAIVGTSFQGTDQYVEIAALLD